MVTSRDRGRSRVLTGRDRERRALERLLEAARAGRSGALVLRGESGVGKSALLGHAYERASECRVVSVSAVKSEMRLAFAVLHQLCAPLSEGLERLPDPQRAALDVAFGRIDGVPTDPFFLGLAVLSLLSAAADKRPLVCLIDNGQWSDPESSQVIGVVARRLPDSVMLVLAARDRHSEFACIPELHLGGLPDGDARALLMSALRAPLDEQVRERIVAEAAGNPRALLEVPRGVTPPQLAGGFGEPGVGLVSSRADGNLTRQLCSLPDDSRRLLLVAAAEPHGDPLLFWRAAKRLGIRPGAASAAQASGVLVIAARVQFRHPLMRAAIYQSATPRERWLAHGALADAIDPQCDPARRAWHRAHAASAPDENVAAELERVSRRAGDRGGVAAEAVFLRHAAMLTPGPRDRARRALASADASRRAGDSDGALQTLATAEAGPLDALGHARAELLRARVALSSGAADAARRLYTAARRLEPFDIDLARDAYLDTFAAIVRLGTGEGCDPIEVADAAVAARRSRPPRWSDLLLDGLAQQLTQGYAAAAPTLRHALEAFGDDDLSAGDGLGAGWIACHVASTLLQHDTEHAAVQRQVRLARRTGALGALPPALAQLAGIHMRRGELAHADALLFELESNDAATRSEPAAQMEIMLAAYRGREAEGRRLIDDARRHLPQPAVGLGASVVQLASLVLNNGLGRYDDALRGGRGSRRRPRSRRRAGRSRTTRRARAARADRVVQRLGGARRRP